MTRITRSLICTLLVISMLLMLGVAPAFASSVPAWINNSYAPVYTALGNGSLPCGTSVNVSLVKNGWALFECGGYAGVVQSKFLTAKQGITGYVSKRNVYAYQYPSLAAKSVGPLPVGMELKVVGFFDAFAQVTNGQTLAFIPAAALSTVQPSATAIMASKVLAVNWWTAGQYVLNRGGYGYLYDILSGQVIHVKRLGGTNHMELEPATAEDTVKLLSACGGSFSWDSRPVIFYANGYFLAAAINTMPHGDQSITNNNYEGQFCMHMVGSLTHASQSINTNHQKAILAACYWALAQCKPL